MTESFRDFYDIVEPLVLPIRGTAYEIPPASASSVMRYQSYMQKVRAGQPVDEHEIIRDEEYFGIFLGSALVQMRDDGIHPGAIEHAANTAMIDTIGGREAALIAWNSRDPKAQLPMPDPVSESETDSKPSPSTDGASTTS